VEGRLSGAPILAGGPERNRASEAPAGGQVLVTETRNSTCAAWRGGVLDGFRPTPQAGCPEEMNSVATCMAGSTTLTCCQGPRSIQSQ